MWYDEVTKPGYNFLKPGMEANPGTERFTQMVWRGSTKLGCGINENYVVCRYCEEAGNTEGDAIVNVYPKKYACKTKSELDKE